MDEQPKKLKSTVKKTTATPKNWDESITKAKETAAKKAENAKAVEKNIEASMQRIEQKAASTPSAPEEVKDDDTFKSYFSDDAGMKTIENTPYVETPEESARREKCLADKNNDASEYIHDIIGADDAITKATEYIEQERKNDHGLTRAELNEKIESNPELKQLYEWAANLRGALEDNEMFGQQKHLLISMIDALNRHDQYLKELDQKLTIAKISAKLDGKPKLYKGDEAIQLINNRYRGVYRVNLHNSGFWIKIVPMSPANLDAWMQEIDFQYKQIGRLIGGHFYLGLGVYLKEKLADLLRLTTIDSNLQNWKEGSTLIDSISLQDYETICWAYATIMHRDGITISTVCTNPECKHTNRQQFVDLARCSYINPAVYTKEAITFMIEGCAPGVIRTKEALQNYRTKLLKNVRLINFNETDQLELRDPSLGQYIRTGMKVMGELIAAVNGGDSDNKKPSIDDDKARRETANRLSMMLSPWIARVICKDQAGNVQAVIEDQKAITDLLETIIGEKDDIISNIEQFITESKVAFYGFINAKCPKCGKQLDLLKDNIDPIDTEYILFCLSYLKLEQIGRTA